MSGYIGKRSLYSSFFLTFGTVFGICLEAFLSGALAQPSSPVPSPSAISQLTDPRYLVKAIIIACFLLALFICFLVSLGILLYSGDPKKVEFASDAIKTLTGFFIGSITGYLG
jgi:hypothetical protein